MNLSTEDLIYENEHYTFYWLEGSHTLWVCAQGSVTNAAFKAAHLALIHEAQARYIRYLVMDERQLERIPTQGRLWLVSSVLPSAQAAAIAQHMEVLCIVTSGKAQVDLVTRLIQRATASLTGVEVWRFTTPEATLAAIGEAEPFVMASGH